MAVDLSWRPFASRCDLREANWWGWSQARSQDYSGKDFSTSIKEDASMLNF